MKRRVGDRVEEESRSQNRVENAESNMEGTDLGIWISSDLFARYVESDLDRWRQVLGRQVQHNDSRWGTGTVEAVTWGSPCDHVPSYVQVRIGYEAGWSVVLHSKTWQQHHRQISVPARIEAIIRQCLDTELSESEQSDCLAKHARELREQRDREILERREARQRL